MDNNIYEFEALTLNVPNKNGRVYPRAVIEKELVRYKKEFIDERRAMVTTYNNNSMVNLKDVVGIVTEAVIKDNKLMVKVETLDTLAFHSLLIDGKFNKDCFNVAPFGMATLKDNVVQDDYELIGFHIDPDYGKKD